MNLLANWVQTPAATALVWTLIHSLWEGALVALVLAAALSVFRGSRARYAAACVALVVLLAAFGMTLANELAHAPIATAHTGTLRLAPLDLGAGASIVRPPRGLADFLPWLAPFWIAGVLLFHLRSLAGWIGARRLRRTGVCCAPAPWQERLAHLAARLRISAPVVLFESCLADVPLVIGFLRPVILMPVGLLAGLPAAQVEALLLHELAHIRRHDYLVNLLQVFVEGLVFYHPAVWWIAAVIRAERENCCDDLVVATQGDAYQYATALAALEYHRGDARQPALAATGGNIVKRVRRLLAQPETPRSALTPILSAAILTVTIVAALAAWQTKPAAPAPVKQLAQARPITDEQRKQREEKLRTELESPYRRWLNEDVAYIISNEERTAFKALQSDPEREHFIEQFWLRRDPTPNTPANEMKEEHYRRIAYANQNFTTASGLPGWKTDRGRIYISYGPPDQKESHPGGGNYESAGVTNKTYPFEQWRYRFIEGIGTDIIIEFVDPTMTGEYRMTKDPSEKNILPAVKALAVVQILGSSAVISVPMASLRTQNAFSRVSGDAAPYGRARITGRILKGEAVVTTFEDTTEASTPSYVKTIPLAIGAYQLQLQVKDLATGRETAQTTDFEVK